MRATASLLGKANPGRCLSALLGPRRRACDDPGEQTTEPGSHAPDGVRGKNVLVVDDDPIMLKAASIKLGSQGLTVTTATDGASAIRTVRERKPDIILLDLTFPPDVAHGGGVPWDGYLIMSWLRRLGEGADIPVIVVTAGAPAEHQQRSIAAGARGFFQKPVDYSCLLAAIGRCVCPKTNEAGPATAGDYQI